jgi:hypothetical protein
MRSYYNKKGLGWNQWRDDSGLLHVELTGEGFLSDEEAAKLKAEFLTEDSFEILAEEDCNIYLPREESVLDLFAPPMSPEEDLADRLFLVFRKGAIPHDLCEAARRGLRGAARPSKNRGIAGGKVTPEGIHRPGATIVPVGDGTRARYYTADGILSDTVEANVTMGGIAGFFPPTARHPYCRATAFTRDNWGLFQESWPFLQHCARLFEELNPIRYANQMGFVKQHSLDERGWVVPGTPYSTITVNKNFQTACHQDAGDLKSGFENFSVLEGGSDKYRGGYTVFPKFRIAFNCRNGDFVGMDVAHHWHGNTPIEPLVEGKEDYERISLVMYVREDLAGAGTQEEEQAKYEAWHGKHRNPKEQHEFRKGVALEERQKDADFMKDFGDR